jgi:hypothetical protein
MTVPLHAVAGVDEHAVHLRRIGVALGTKHLGRDHTGDAGADVLHLLHLHTERSQHGSERVGIVADRGEVVEPGEDEFHGVPLRTAR